MPGSTKGCGMKLRWRDWYSEMPVLVQEPAWCSHLLVAGRWLELRQIVGSHTAVEAVLEAWAWEGLQMLAMDRALLYKVVLLMVRKETAEHRSLRD